MKIKRQPVEEAIAEKHSNKFLMWGIGGRDFNTLREARCFLDNMKRWCECGKRFIPKNNEVFCKDCLTALLTDKAIMLTIKQK